MSAHTKIEEAIVYVNAKPRWKVVRLRRGPVSVGIVMDDGTVDRKEMGDEEFMGMARRCGWDRRSRTAPSPRTPGTKALP